MTTLADWLTTLEPARLQAILDRRPDVRDSLDAVDAASIAARLQHPASLRLLAEQLTLPQLQVLEVVVALGARATPAAVAELLEDSGDGHESCVLELLLGLYETGAAWPLPDGGIGTVRATPALFPEPLGTSGTLAALIEPLSLPQLRDILAAQGHPRSIGPREAAAAAVVATLSDPAWVRAQVLAAESDIRDPLLALAKGAHEPASAADYSDIVFEQGQDLPTDPWGRRRTRHELFQEQSWAVRWAGERGIVIGLRWGYEWQMPSEVALALRGTAYRAPFSRWPPPAPIARADPADVRSAMGAAVADFSQQAIAVLDMVARYSWPMARTGGLAARELSRLARTAVVTTSAARLVLELADHADLLVKRHGCLTVSDGFGAWRAAEPQHRFAALLRSWWWLPFAPTATSSGRRKSIRPLERSVLCLPTDGARLALIPLLAGLAPHEATTLPALLEMLRWQRPRLSSIAGYQPEPWSIAWTEAEALGVIAAGVLTPLGRALPRTEAGMVDTEALAATVADVLPPVSDRVLLDSDLTAMVVGLPTAALTVLLDSIAHRESNGTAVTWRFTERSIRGALDDGSDIATLTAHLESLSGGDLPQPLTHLLRDVGRRHGELRLSDHGTLLRSEDPILMTQLLHDRSLHRLGLRLLAPTIVTSRLTLVEALDALRRAGYYPVPEGDPAEWIDLPAAG